MAKTGSKKKPDLKVVGGHTPPGHNSGASVEELNDEQQQALFFQHMRKIGDLKKKLASVNGDLRSAYKVAKAEGFTKKDLDFAFDLEKDEDEKMVEDRRRQAQIARWMSHPIGTQADLFGSGTPTDDRPLRERAFDEGKRDGMKSEGPLKPPYDSGDGYDGYVEGWHRGQEVLLAAIKKPEEPVLLRPEGNEPAGPDAFDAAADDVPEPPPAPDAEPDVVAEAEPAAADNPWPDDAAVAAREEAEVL